MLMIAACVPGPTRQTGKPVIFASPGPSTSWRISSQCQLHIEKHVCGVTHGDHNRMAITTLPTTTLQGHASPAQITPVIAVHATPRCYSKTNYQETSIQAGGENRSLCPQQ